MDDKISEWIRKGTTTVGIKCADGVVLAADKRVTLGGQIIANKTFDKVYKITENIAITMAGSVSDAQLITKLIKAELKLIKIRTGRDASVRESANLLGAIVYHNIRKFSPFLGITGFLLGGTDSEGFHLYDIGIDGSIIEHEDYVTDGSGFMMAYGVFDTLYKKDIKVQDGIKLAVKAINAAMQRDTATGEGIDVLTVTKQGIKKVLTKQIETNISI